MVAYDSLLTLEQKMTTLAHQAQEATLSHVHLPPDGSDYFRQSMMELSHLIQKEEALPANIDRKIGNILHLTIYPSSSSQQQESLNEQFLRSGWGFVPPRAPGRDDLLREQCLQAEQDAKKSRVNQKEKSKKN